MKEVIFKGSPAEVGAEFFIQANMPFFREASGKMPDGELAQLYAGFIGAALGSLAADFDQPTAIIIFNYLAATFEKTPLHPGGMMQ